MRDAEAAHVRAHSLSLESRSKAAITGVEAVESFNEQMVVLSTSAGMLTLLGSGLHVSRLSLDDGQLLVEGDIAALEYDERRGKSRGLMSRLFR